ncbi:MAG: Mth938-like domain-containing protein [Thermodesulfobacteriota bacterium]
MHIDSYEFGLIRIDGQTFRNDILIWPGQIKSDWWRRESHLLQLDDVAEALVCAPQVLVVGQGNPGRMEVDPALAAYLRETGVDLMVFPTKHACQVINELSPKRRLAAALHLTC